MPRATAMPTGRRFERLWCFLALLALAAPSPVRGEPATLDVPADSAELRRQVAEYDRRIAAAPERAENYLKRGEAHFRLQNFDQAIDDFSAALKRDDRLDDAYFGRGMALGRRGQVGEGIADLGVYLERRPDSSLAYTKRGVRHLWNGDQESAEKDLRRAIALDPRNAEAHDDLGVILAQRGEFDAAIGHFRATLKAEPSYHKAHHNLAMVYYITGENRLALASVDAALKLAGESRDSMLLKATILEALGRHTEAKVTREEAEFLPEGNRSERAAVQ
ncbi:MAG: tetratricopeptide repeat protein [Pseudomonadota bacterium]